MVARHRKRKKLRERVIAGKTNDRIRPRCSRWL